MVSRAGVTHSPPEILSGTPVFVGTRVPVRALFDYLEGGEPLADLPHQFPSVKREQTIAVLDAPLKGARRMQRLLVKDLTPMFSFGPAPCTPPAWVIARRRPPAPPAS